MLISSYLNSRYIHVVGVSIPYVALIRNATDKGITTRDVPCISPFHRFYLPIQPHVLGLVMAQRLVTAAAQWRHLQHDVPECLYSSCSKSSCRLSSLLLRLHPSMTKNVRTFPGTIHMFFMAITYRGTTAQRVSHAMQHRAVTNSRAKSRPEAVTFMRKSS